MTIYRDAAEQDWRDHDEGLYDPDVIVEREREDRRFARLEEMSLTNDGVVARFWAKVDKLDNGCWVWMASRYTDGYGKFALTHAKSVRAHRFAYELEVGPIPEGLVIDHLCRVPLCVNPSHLEPVTNLENIRRGARANQTHCKNGHEFTPENTYRPPATPNTRQCRECARAATRRWRGRVGSR